MAAYRTSAQLSAGIRRYFGAVSYQEPVTRRRAVTEELEENGEVLTVPVLDAYGHPLYALEPVMKTKKQQATQTVWIEPPCLPALLMALKLSTEEWEQLRQEEEFAQVCRDAERRIEIFNVQQLATGRASGAKYALGCKFGWNERQQTQEGVRMEILGAEDFSG